MILCVFVFLCSVLHLRVPSMVLHMGIFSSFSFLYRILLFECVTVLPWFYCWWTLGPFTLLNNESINILIYVFWCRCAHISVGCKPRKGMRMFSFNRYCQIVSKVAVPIYTPTINMWRFSLLQILSNAWDCQLF